MINEHTPGSAGSNTSEKSPHREGGDGISRRDFFRHVRDAAIAFAASNLLLSPDANATERLIVVERALELARQQVGKPFSANEQGDPLQSHPPESFVCTSLVMWSYYKASNGVWSEWRPSDTILDLNGLNGRPALVKFFDFEDERDLQPGDILYRSPHTRHKGESKPRNFYDKAGEPGFNEKDPRHDYHHTGLYAGNSLVIQAGGDRRGDTVLAGPSSYSVRVTQFDLNQWAPDAGRPRRLLRKSVEE